MEALLGWIRDLLAGAPDDPLVLIGAALLAWLPVCALLLGVLSVLAAAQYRLSRGRRARIRLVMPAAERRPLAARRFITNPRRTNGVLAAARLLLAVAVVLGFSAAVLATSGPYLLASLAG
ncbi:MAG TPA: hypothetical protein VHS99_06225 [Chloroflexota bacterium]|jgi:hypothetical protein|nr:hypothetical protein [Chloroflexota bacterium]